MELEALERRHPTNRRQSDETEKANSNKRVANIEAVRSLTNMIALRESFKEIDRQPTRLAPIILAALATMAGNAIYCWR